MLCGDPARVQVATGRGSLRRLTKAGTSFKEVGLTAAAMVRTRMRLALCERYCALIAVSVVLVSAANLGAQDANHAEWPYYGRDRGGTRYSPLTQITPENVARLEVAWTFHTGEGGVQPSRGTTPALESTPLVVDGALFFDTPQGRVIALDPASGEKRWVYDPHVDPHAGYNAFWSRGVSTWLDTVRAPGRVCRRRIFAVVTNARLVSLDAATGRLCLDFGVKGKVDLRRGLRIPPFEPGAYTTTSPPAVIGNLVIAGSAITDDATVAPASGEVRAFDARTGRLVWSWDPIPQSAADPAHASWEAGSAARTGGANAWTVLTTDPDRDLLFVPTSSPAPDYFGGRRLGDNRYANSIVALRASTGAVVWHFQTVHHDLWNYDNAAPAALVDIERGAARVPAVIVATKTGMLFVLHRETGTPLFPVEERPVPASDVAGERASPTQPFTAVTLPLSPHAFHADSVWGLTQQDRDACRDAILPLRNEGIFTPPSLRGSLIIPGGFGGAQWGGVTVDPHRQLVVIPINRVAAIVQLVPRASWNAGHSGGITVPGGVALLMQGTPYIARSGWLVAPSGVPCTPPPFGALVAVDLRTGAKAWEVPLGTFPGTGPGASLGSPNLGGPIATASGLVFVAATLDHAIRAFDIESGRELWKASLPAGGRATPMTYEASGQQYVVVAAGGGGPFGDGDALIAFALQKAAKR